LKKRLKNHLSQFVSSEDLSYIYDSYDVIGDIAIIRVTEKSRNYSRIIAETIMNVQKNAKTVLAQTSSVCGDFRLKTQLCRWRKQDRHSSQGIRLLILC